MFTLTAGPIAANLTSHYHLCSSLASPFWPETRKNKEEEEFGGEKPRALTSTQIYNCGRLVRIIVIFINLHNVFYFSILCKHYKYIYIYTYIQKSFHNTCLQLENTKARQKAVMVKLSGKSSSWWLHIYWEKDVSLHTPRPAVKLVVTKAVVVKIQYWAQNAVLSHKTSAPNLTTKQDGHLCPAGANKWLFFLVTSRHNRHGFDKIRSFKDFNRRSLSVNRLH